MHGGGQPLSASPAWACPLPRLSSSSPPPPAGASGLSVHVSPSRGLVDGQGVTVSGRGPGPDLRRQAPDLVRRRVHRIRPAPHEPLHRHPAL